MKNIANEEGRSVSHERYRGQLKTLINEKIKVLKDFYIVDRKNEAEIRAYLEKVLADNPKGDPRIVLDRAAAPLIQEKLKTI